jgi:hypothetical protein
MFPRYTANKELADCLGAKFDRTRAGQERIAEIVHYGCSSKGTTNVIKSYYKHGRKPNNPKITQYRQNGVILKESHSEALANTKINKKKKEEITLCIPTIITSKNMLEDKIIYCDMSNRCWATGGGTSYHEDRPLINGRLPSYGTVETRLRNSKESGVCPCRAEPKRAAQQRLCKHGVTQQGSPCSDCC